jgi:hypothetical protein
MIAVTLDSGQVGFGFPNWSLPELGDYDFF